MATINEKLSTELAVLQANLVAAQARAADEQKIINDQIEAKNTDMNSFSKYLDMEVEAFKAMVAELIAKLG